MLRPRKPANPFRYFNSSPEVIRLVVVMYVRFPMSLRNVEDLMVARFAMRRFGSGGTDLGRCSCLISRGSGSIERAALDNGIVCRSVTRSTRGSFLALKQLFYQVFRYEALKIFAFVVDGVPQIVRLSIGLQKHLINVPIPGPTNPARVFRFLSS